MSIKKKFLKSKPLCKTTFVLPKLNAKNAKSVHLVGEFNQWDEAATPMKKMANGNFSITLDLPKGKSYQFRYLIDKQLWENDDQADQYAFNEYAAADNSVINLN